MNEYNFYHGRVKSETNAKRKNIFVHTMIERKQTFIKFKKTLVK